MGSSKKCRRRIGGGVRGLRVRSCVENAVSRVDCKRQGPIARDKRFSAHVQTTIWAPKCPQVSGVPRHDGCRDEEASTGEHQTTYRLETVSPTRRSHLVLAGRSHERLSFSSHSQEKGTNIKRGIYETPSFNRYNTPWIFSSAQKY